MPNRTFTFVVETQIPYGHVLRLLEFIVVEFLKKQPAFFTDISLSTTHETPTLSYTIQKGEVKKIKVEITGSKPLQVNFTTLNDVTSEREILLALENVRFLVIFYEEGLRESTVFFAWREGESMVPESLTGNEKGILRAILTETQVILMIAFMAIGLALFTYAGPLLLLFLIFTQFIFVYYSGNIITRTADWTISEENPIIQILEFPLPPEDKYRLDQLLQSGQLQELKNEVYTRTIMKTGTLDCQVAHPSFTKYGLECIQEELRSKRVNVYEIVKEVADRFGLPMPMIAVSNTVLPNASASGPSPSRGVLLITTGLLTRLNEDEVKSVIGHEMSHLKGFDPLWLFTLSSLQYILWFILLSEVKSFIIFFIYLWAVSTLTFFVSKFFEAKADLVSAVTMGQPNVFAGALERIGYIRLLLERSPVFRLQEWVGLDPHPPMYFRISRLRALDPSSKLAYPLIRSAKDVIIGFLHSLSG